MNELIRIFGKNAKRDILNYVLTEYFEFDKYKYNALCLEIGERNSNLQNRYGLYNFYYKGKMWPTEKTIQCTELHKSFHKEMDILIPQINMMDKAEIQIANYIRKLLTPCNTLTDILSLMPRELCEYLPNAQFGEHLKDSVLTLSSDRVLHLQEKHKQGLAEIKAYAFYKSLFIGK